jgi:hypothetical protein
MVLLGVSVHPEQGGFVFKCNVGCSFSKLTDKRQPDSVVSFTRLSKGYYHCDPLFSSRHRLLNLPGMRPTTER